MIYSLIFVCLSVSASASGAAAGSAQECLDSGADELDESAALQEVLLLQMGHDLKRAAGNSPALSPTEGVGPSVAAQASAPEHVTSAPVAQNVSVQPASEVSKQNRSAAVSASSHARRQPDDAQASQQNVSSAAADAGGRPAQREAAQAAPAAPSAVHLKHMTPMRRATSSLPAELQDASTWEQLKFVLSNPIKDLWANETQSLSEEDAKAGVGHLKRDTGIGAWILLVAAMTLWTFLLIECCKGGIHWGNTEQFAENAGEKAAKPQVPATTGGQKDVASVARRAKEISTQQANQKGCC